ncbi:hypothetical protein D3C73_913490 [compost metagenome]
MSAKEIKAVYKLYESIRSKLKASACSGCFIYNYLFWINSRLFFKLSLIKAQQVLFYLTAGIKLAHYRHNNRFIYNSLSSFYNMSVFMIFRFRYQPTICSLKFSTKWLFSIPHLSMIAMTGNKLIPKSVRLYSTFSGSP